jgi:hypothetical protein
MTEPIDPKRGNLWLMIVLLVIVVALGFVTRGHQIIASAGTEDHFTILGLPQKPTRSNLPASAF